MLSNVSVNLKLNVFSNFAVLIPKSYVLFCNFSLKITLGGSLSITGTFACLPTASAISPAVFVKLAVL